MSDIISLPLNPQSLENVSIHLNKPFKPLKVPKLQLLERPPAVYTIVGLPVAAADCSPCAYCFAPATMSEGLGYYGVPESQIEKYGMLGRVFKWLDSSDSLTAIFQARVLHVLRYLSYCQVGHLRKVR
ncbi:hypothetical protein L195_g003705 [Trifolium pratense]|uniref:Uncharacterized protein n=1 Tax=Trifolium pratense TaxID=57577 RepID=A0A2K3NVZ3_TRIPR|nr:hypothetical protein L195_g003705 [Trifolium pratense]